MYIWSVCMYVSYVCMYVCMYEEVRPSRPGVCIFRRIVARTYAWFCACHCLLQPWCALKAWVGICLSAKTWSESGSTSPSCFSYIFHNLFLTENVRNRDKTKRKKSLALEICSMPMRQHAACSGAAPYSQHAAACCCCMPQQTNHLPRTWWKEIQEPVGHLREGKLSSHDIKKQRKQRVESMVYLAACALRSAAKVTSMASGRVSAAVPEQIHEWSVRLLHRRMPPLWF
jgi:hypothetical protein